VTFTFKTDKAGQRKYDPRSGVIKIFSYSDPDQRRGEGEVIGEAKVNFSNYIDESLQKYVVKMDK